MLEKTLEVPWTARRLNQSMLKEISPEYSLEGLMLKLKLQYFGYLMQWIHSREKTLILGKTEGKRRRGRQRMKCLDGITDSMDMGLGGLRVGDGQGELACCSPWGCKELDTTEQLNWTYGLPRWYSGKEFACHCRSCKRCMFNPWIRKIPWRKKWKPTPVFLPRKFQGQRNLADYSPWGCKELDMTEHTPST